MPVSPTEKKTSAPRKAAPAKSGHSKADKAAPVKAAKAPATPDKAAPAKAPKPPAKTARPAARARPAGKGKVAPWEPVAIPTRPVGKPDDPRLAAALAARERWHGRSGRPALKSGTQAVAFARERRLVQVAVPSALPNLVDPVLGRPCTPAERTGGVPGTTLAGWQRELAASPDLLELRLAFEQPTFVQSELWQAVATVAAPREEAARDGGLLTAEASEALELVDRKGVIPAERLRQLLGLGAKDFARVQGELEARLLVLARGDVDDDDRPITVLEPLSRWVSRSVPPKRLEPHQAWTLLFAAAVRAAVVIYPDELPVLFPWSPAEQEAAIAAAMQAGAVVTYPAGLGVAYVASPVPR